MKKIRTSTIRQMKKSGEKIVALTAYDTITASLAQSAGVDILLVGDSVGNTALGFETTINVTLDMMIHHAAAVTRGASRPLIIGDMPFMTYKVSAEQALTNAGRFVQEGGVEGVKIEGGAEMAEIVRKLVEAGIPVMAHIGLLPQSIHAQGGFRVQGREAEDAERLTRDARTLQEAGAFSIVLECMPSAIAGQISQSIQIPTIGIGAGAECDGQILVISDLLGMTDRKLPKFVKAYANLHAESVKAIAAYAAEVRGQKFPGAENIYE